MASTLPGIPICYGGVVETGQDVSHRDSARSKPAFTTCAVLNRGGCQTDNFIENIFTRKGTKIQQVINRNVDSTIRDSFILFSFSAKKVYLAVSCTLSANHFGQFLLL